MNISNRLQHTIYNMFLVLALVPGPVWAETMYVSDELEITLRNGPGITNKINKMLKSGEPLEIIGRNSEGYAQVTTQDGIKGWVLTRFLMEEPSAKSRMNELIQREADLSSQQQEIEKLRTTVQLIEQNANAMKIANAELEAELANVKQISADTVAIYDKNKELTTSLEKAEANQIALQAENERLKNNTEQAWFLRGAGVILLGMVLGLLIPKLRFRKKRKWGDFSSYS